MKHEVMKPGNILPVSHFIGNFLTHTLINLEKLKIRNCA